MQLKYKSYWRKSGLKGKWGNIFLERLSNYNPKNVLEIGVFCGVTAKNTCDFLYKLNGNNFSYTGIDLFGIDQKNKRDEIKPTGFIVGIKKVYVSLNNGKLIIADILTGKIISTLKIDNQKISHPFVVDRNLFVIKDNAIIKLN